jgi:hypothetical protein
MKRVVARHVVGLALAAGFVAPVFAKGLTVKLTVTGPGLPRPTDVTDPPAILPNVWAGDFVDWHTGPVEEPARELSRYLIKFHVALARSETRMMYVVIYVWDPTARRAVVHLPGRGDEWYRLNVRTILRDGQDGQWFYASEGWGRAIRRSLVRSRASK